MAVGRSAARRNFIQHLAELSARRAAPVNRPPASRPPKASRPPNMQGKIVMLSCRTLQRMKLTLPLSGPLHRYRW
jgi:hypothetical protein